VVLVALIQGFMAGVGLFAVGVPAAGLWTGAVIIVAVAQIPTLVVLGPIIIYVFSVQDSTTVAVLFTIWCLLVGLSDNFLKPLFLGRGVRVPMLVILIGAIGGMIAFGILGLFLGAVILAMGYEIFRAWLAEAPAEAPAADEPPAGEAPAAQ
jgi:predicted PurR-regulated permease PerM